MKYAYSIAIAATLLFTSCGQKNVSSAKAFSEWLNNEENGCKVQREVNGMLVEVKYLPAEFLALKDYEVLQGRNYDSLVNTYRYSTTFLLTFKPKDEAKGEDVMYKDVENYRQYIERSMTLNFDLESKVSLQTGAGQYRPVLSSLENTYGLSKGRTIYMVFAGKSGKDELNRAAYYDLTYTDEIYKLGILHFIFNRTAIDKALPIVNIHHA